MQPKPIVDTVGPVRPNFRCFIIVSCRRRAFDRCGHERTIGQRGIRDKVDNHE